MPPQATPGLVGARLARRWPALALAAALLASPWGGARAASDGPPEVGTAPSADAPAALDEAGARPPGRDLVIILPGLGDSAKGRRHMAAWGDMLAPLGYDVVVPDYIDSDTVEQTVANLTRFFEEEIEFDAYNEVHIFAFIIGTWSLNLYLEDHEIPGLKSLVYDRSPLQERAPAVVARRIKLLTRLMLGRIVENFAQVAYPPLDPLDGVAIGLVIENRATFLIRVFRRTALAMGPLTFDADALGQPHDDRMYTPINHDEMYVSFEQMGLELLHFFEHGHFQDGASRAPLEGDPFSRKPSGLTAP